MPINKGGSKGSQKLYIARAREIFVHILYIEKYKVFFSIHKKAVATPLGGAPSFFYFQIVTAASWPRWNERPYAGHSKQVVLLCGHRKKFV